jgi:hypothetical protein
MLKVNDENSRIRIQDPDPDPLVRSMDPRIRIRIHPKMSWIRNTAIWHRTKNWLRSQCLAATWDTIHKNDRFFTNNILYQSFIEVCSAYVQILQMPEGGGGGWGHHKWSVNYMVNIYKYLKRYWYTVLTEYK